MLIFGMLYRDDSGKLSLIFGMLYRDDSGKLSETELIEVTRQAFEKKCGEKADLALLSISAEKVPEVEGLLVTRSHLVFPRHALVGVAVNE